MTNLTKHGPCGHWHKKIVYPPPPRIGTWYDTLPSFGVGEYSINYEFAWGTQFILPVGGSITKLHTKTGIAFLLGTTINAKMAIYNTSGVLLSSLAGPTAMSAKSTWYELTLATPLIATVGQTVALMVQTDISCWISQKEGTVDGYYVETPYSTFPPPNLSLSVWPTFCLALGAYIL